MPCPEQTWGIEGVVAPAGAAPKPRPPWYDCLRWLGPAYAVIALLIATTTYVANPGAGTYGALLWVVVMAAASLAFLFALICLPVLVGIAVCEKRWDWGRAAVLTVVALLGVLLQLPQPSR